MTKHDLIESDIAALIKQIARDFRAVETAAQLKALAANSETDILKLRTKADSNNVQYWLTQARRSAYALHVDNNRPRTDISTTLYSLSMARREQRKYERQFPAYYAQLQPGSADINFENALDAGLAGNQQAIMRMIGWLEGASADERETAAYMLAELLAENKLDEEQLHFAQGAANNIRQEYRTPGIRYLLSLLNKTLEAQHG